MEFIEDHQTSRHLAPYRTPTWINPVNYLRIKYCRPPRRSKPSKCQLTPTSNPGSGLAPCPFSPLAFECYDHLSWQCTQHGWHTLSVVAGAGIFAFAKVLRPNDSFGITKTSRWQETTPRWRDGTFNYLQPVVRTLGAEGAAKRQRERGGEQARW